MLANRLSEDEMIRVLLLEAGGDGLSDSIRDPSKMLNNFNDPARDWMYETTEQKHACLNNKKSVCNKNAGSPDSTSTTYCFIV